MTRYLGDRVDKVLADFPCGGSMACYLGDCLDVLPTLPDGCVDMVFADLPYGVTGNRWDFKISLSKLWPELVRVSKQQSALVFTATQPFATTLITSQPSLFRYDMVWTKSQTFGFLNVKRRPLSAHEGILVFSRASCNSQSASPMTYNPQMTIGLPYVKTCARGSEHFRSSPKLLLRRTNQNFGERWPTTHLAIRNPKIRGGHPTQKPVALLEWIVRTFSNPGDTILDPTMGSGTTGVACRNTGRNFIGIERDQAYFETARKRILASRAPQQEALAL